MFGLARRHRIRYGEVYEDCSYHPCVCFEADRAGWPSGWRRWLGLTMDIDVKGVSLLDSSERSCSARHCAPVRLTDSEVLDIMQNYHHYQEITGRGEWAPPWWSRSHRCQAGPYRGPSHPEGHEPG